MAMEHVTLAEVLEGTIPPTLEGIAEIAGDLFKLSQRVVQVTALLIAAADRDHFAGKGNDWINWCLRHFPGMDKSEIHHRRQIGKLLLKVRDQYAETVFKRLFVLDSRKLLPMARLDAAKIPAFLSHYQVEGMSRQEVRDAVATYLGEAVPERMQQQRLPGFEESLDALCHMSDSGFNWEYAVADEKSADKCLTSGMGLLGAALAWQKRQKVADVELLQAAKTALLDEVREIETTIAASLGEAD